MLRLNFMKKLETEKEQLHAQVQMATEGGCEFC